MARMIVDAKLVIVALLGVGVAACASTVEPGGSGGGSGEGGGRATTGAVTSAQAPAATTDAASTDAATTDTTTTDTAVAVDAGVVSSGSAPTSTTSTDGECRLDEPVFGDERCDACAQVECCGDSEACLADPDGCRDRHGQVDPESPLGGALIRCMEGNCSAECSGSGCNPGISFGDDAVDACIFSFCCDELEACAEDDPRACIDCFNAGGTGPLCADAVACVQENGCFDPSTTCDTGFGFGDPDVDACLTENCCEEWDACASKGEQACIDCVNAGGADPLCSDALACGDENGCFG